MVAKERVVGGMAWEDTKTVPGSNQIKEYSHNHRFSIVAQSSKPITLILR